MAAQGNDKKDRAKPAKAGDRRARLEQALRVNLLKRKAKARSRKAPQAPREEGGQR